MKRSPLNSRVLCGPPPSTPPYPFRCVWMWLCRCVRVCIAQLTICSHIFARLLLFLFNLRCMCVRASFFSSLRFGVYACRCVYRYAGMKACRGVSVYVCVYTHLCACMCVYMCVMILCLYHFFISLLEKTTKVPFDSIFFTLPP